MKVRPIFWKTLLFLIVTIVVGSVILFLVCMSFFLNKEWDWRQWTIIALWAVSTVALILFTFLSNYYEVERRYVVVHKPLRKLMYNYNDVVYIDEEKSEKKKTICFYTNKHDTRYIMFDRKGILYHTMLKNCKNRLCKEDFERRYPKVKL